MSKFHLKVQLNDVGLVVIAQHPNGPVSGFLRELSTRFFEYGAKFEEADLQGRLEITDLSTADGYSLKPSDVLSEVLNSGDRVVAQTYGGWLKKHSQLIVKEWLCLQSPDDKDNLVKWASVGYHGHNKLYIQFGTGYPYSDRVKPKILGLHLYGLSTLTGIPDGRKSVCQVGEGNWFAEAFFVVEGGNVTYVDLCVKSNSDARACIKRLKVQVGSTIAPDGDAVTTQQTFEEFSPAEYVHKIPLNTNSGPELTIKPKPADSPLAKAAGDIPIQIQQKGQVTADQNWAREGSFDNSFNIPLKVTNAKDVRVLVTSVTAQYHGKDGEWKDVECTVGDKGDDFAVDGIQTTEINVIARIKITAPQVDRYRRAHMSLPDPLNIKLKFEDANGGKSEMDVQYNNPPLDLQNREYRQKNNSDKEMLFWAQCDDVTLEQRIFSDVFLSEDRKNLIIATKSNSSTYWTGSTIRRKANSAASENNAEVLVEDLCWKDDFGSSVRVSLLVDVEKRQGYALKFELKTNSSENTSYCPIPVLKEN